MIFTRLTTPATMRRGTLAASESTPSTRKRTRMLPSPGLEVDVRGAQLDRLGDDLVDELDDRGVVRGLAQVDDLGLLLGPLVGGVTTWSRRDARWTSARMSSREATTGRTS